MKPEKPSAETGRSAVRIRPQGLFIKMEGRYIASLDYIDGNWTSVLVEKQEGEDRSGYCQLLLVEDRVTSFNLSSPIGSAKFNEVRDGEVKKLLEYLEENPDSKIDVSGLVGKL